MTLVRVAIIWTLDVTEPANTALKNGAGDAQRAAKPNYVLPLLCDHIFKVTVTAFSVHFIFFSHRELSGNRSF